MGKVYFFPSSAVIYNDKVIPIILELAAQGNRVHTVFLDFQAYKNLGIGGPYAEWLRAFTRCRTLITTEQLHFFGKVLFVLRYALLMLGMKLSRGYLAFFDAKGATPLGKRLGRITKKNGTSIMFSSSYLDAWQGYDWDEVLKNDAYCRKMKGKSSEAYKKGKKKIVEMYNADKVLLYNKNLIVSEKHLQDMPACVVPHPKLQRWWRDFIVTYPPRYDDMDVAPDDRWISVILTHKGNFFFRDDIDVDILVSEIIKSVREVFPETNIVIKPKQTVLRQKDWFAQWKKTILDPRVYFADIPVAILAGNSLAGIMVGHSTAQFEFMVGDAPWIEYCRYSDFWKEVYPKLTYTEEYGGYRAQTPEELIALLRKVKEGQLKNDLETFKREVHFYDQDISFNFFAKQHERR